MDTLQNPPGEAASAPGNSAHAPSLPIMPGGSPLGFGRKCKCGVCPQCVQRAEWRAKYHRRKDKLAGVETPPALPAAPSVVGPTPAQNAPLPPVAHNPADWQPAVDALLSAGEKVSCAILNSKAEKIGDAELIKDIKEHAPWNVASKEIASKTGAPIVAKVAEKIGLPPEAANGTMFVGAMGQIVAHHFALSAKLDKHLARIEELEKKRGGVAK